MKYRPILLSIISILTFSAVNAQNFETITLSGVDTLYADVIINIENLDLRDFNRLMSERLESRLVDNNLVIGDNRYRASLEFVITGLPARSGDNTLLGYAMSYALRFSQAALVPKNGAITYPYTWNRDGIIVSSDVYFKEDISLILDELTDEFINDYHAVNE